MSEQSQALKARPVSPIRPAKPVVAIVGRPNVGKSTLFNRLSRRRSAVVDEKPGTTRDRVAMDVSANGREFVLVDTGGLEPVTTDAIGQKVQEQVRIAVREADALLFLVDAQQGLVPADQEVADLVRRSNKPTLLVAAKVENVRTEAQAAEFYRLGLGEPLPISAYHNVGIQELLERLEGLLPPALPAREEQKAALHLAIVGRPNVGKSLLLNTLIGEERAIVSEVPGTTRDAIDTLVEHNGEAIVLIDTAGIRRRGRVEVGVERFSVLRAMQAIARADVVALVLDATEGPTAQDAHIAGYAVEQHKGILAVVNKWDLAPQLGLKAQDVTQWVQEVLKFAPYAPILLVSALTGKGMEVVLPAAQEIFRERSKVVDAKVLTELVRKAVAAQPLPPAVKVRKRKLELYSVFQAGINPPTFVFTMNHPQYLHFSYRRYLENQLRHRFGFGGTPIRLVFKPRRGTE